jgi:hypothetical protein
MSVLKLSPGALIEDGIQLAPEPLLTPIWRCPTS